MSNDIMIDAIRRYKALLSGIQLPLLVSVQEVPEGALIFRVSCRSCHDSVRGGMWMITLR